MALRNAYLAFFPVPKPSCDVDVFFHVQPGQRVTPGQRKATETTLIQPPTTMMSCMLSHAHRMPYYLLTAEGPEHAYHIWLWTDVHWYGTYLIARNKLRSYM